MEPVSWLSFGLSLLKALPELLQFLNSLKQSADFAEQRGIGRDLAISQALLEQRDAIDAANAAKAEAAKRHADNPNSDDAFDPDFKRKDVP